MRAIFTEAGLNPEEAALVELYLRDDGSRLTVETGSFLSTSAYEKLFDYYSDEMPYLTAKARDGEPDVWILDRIADEEKETAATAGACKAHGNVV